MMAELAADDVMANEIYDIDALPALIPEQDAMPIISPRTNCITSRDYDTHLYHERHLVDCWINKLTDYRCLFSR